MFIKLRAAIKDESKPITILQAFKRVITRLKLRLKIRLTTRLIKVPIKQVSLLTCLMGMSVLGAQASELDPIFYPNRVEWLNIDQLYELEDSNGAMMRSSMGISEVVDGEQALYLRSNTGTAFFDWPSGQWLRLMLPRDQYLPKTIGNSLLASKTPISVWFSFGDGLFQKFSSDAIQKQESQGALQWLIPRPNTTRPLIIMVQAEVSNGVQTPETNANDIERKAAESGSKNSVKEGELPHRERESDDIKIKLFYSKDSNSPALTTHNQRILAEGDTVRTTQSNGRDVETWNHTQANQRISLQLQGPAEYTLHWRSPWYSAYGDQKTIQLGFAIDGKEPVYRMRSMNIDDTHTLNSTICQCVYSRLNSQRIFVKSGEHKVTITADKEILSYWTVSNQSQQYLFGHNQHADFDKRTFWTEDSIFPFAKDEQSFQAVEISSKLNTDQDAWMKQLRHQSQYFYRDLHQSHTNKSSDYWSVPLKLPRTDQQKFWLPDDDYQITGAMTFNQVNPQSNAHFGVPKTAHMPPLKLRLLPMQQRASFSLITNNKQIVKLQFIPSAVQRERLTLSPRNQEKLQNYFGASYSYDETRHKINDYSVSKERDKKERGRKETEYLSAIDDSALTLDEKDYLKRKHSVNMHKIAWAPEQFIQFEKPFEALFLYNYSNEKLMVNVSYKNKQRPKTDQFFLLNQLTLAGAQESILYLSSTDTVTLNSFQGHQWASELKQWQRRLQSRLADFVERYQLYSGKNIALTDSDIKLILEEIGNEYRIEDMNLARFVEVLVQHNKEVTARRVLVQLALQENSAMQQQAQALLVDFLASRERWFDLEGFWSYRLIRQSRYESLAPLAQAVFAQNQFDTAYKWYWLHKRLEPQFEFPTEAILAALKQKQSALVLAMNNTMDEANQYAWHCWFAVAKQGCNDFAHLLPKKWDYWQALDSNYNHGLGKQLIHNQGLDLYFPTWQLNQSQPLNVEVEGPKRLKVTWYQNPVKQREQEPEHWPKINWLDITTQNIINGAAVAPVSRSIPMMGFQQSVNLTRADAEYDYLAGPKEFVIDIAPGIHRLQLSVAIGSGLINLHQLGDLVAELQHDYMAFSSANLNESAAENTSTQKPKKIPEIIYEKISDETSFFSQKDPEQSWINSFNSEWFLNISPRQVHLDDGFYTKERSITAQRQKAFQALSVYSAAEPFKLDNANVGSSHETNSTRPSLYWLHRFYKTNSKALFNPRVGVNHFAIKNMVDQDYPVANQRDKLTGSKPSVIERSDVIQAYFDKWLKPEVRVDYFKSTNQQGLLLSVLRMIYEHTMKAESTQPLNDEWKIQLAALARQYQLPLAIEQVVNLLSGSHSWKPVTSIRSSAGMIKLADIEVKQVNGLTEILVDIGNVLKAEDTTATTQILHQNQRRTISIEAATEQSYQLSMQLQQRMGQFSNTAAVLVVVNGQASTPIIGYAKAKISIALQKGDNTIELSLLSERSQRHKVIYDLVRKRDGVSVFREKSSTYFAATRAQPLEAFIPPQTLIKIEKLFAKESDVDLENNKYKLKETRYQYFKQGAHLTLSEDATQYYRLYYMSTNSQSIEDLPTIAQRQASKQTLDVLHTYWINQTSEKTSVFDQYKLGDQDDGSWGLNLTYRDRSNLDEDTDTQEESFVELGWEYRLKVPDWNSYFKHQLNYREHRDTGLQTLVNQNDWHYRWSKYWSFDTQLDAYYQIGADSDTAQGRFSLYQGSQLNWRQYWHDDLENKLSAKLFFRRIDDGFFEESELDTTPENIAIDDDVFSIYKMQHERGLVVSDTVTYKPWLDTWFRASASLTSNRDFNIGKPDNLGLTLIYRQYFRPLIAKVDLKNRFYFSDDYREKSINRTYLNLALDWEYWTQTGDLWNIDIFYNQDLTRSNRSFGLRFSWNKTYGQGFDDYSPNDMLFNQLRKRHSYFDIDTNEITSDQHE